jgi:hypothetical protein
MNEVSKLIEILTFLLLILRQKYFCSINFLRITGFVDFVYRPQFYTTTKHNVSEIGSVSVLRWREGGAYSVGSHPSPEDANIQILKSCVF